MSISVARGCRRIGGSSPRARATRTPAASPHTPVIAVRRKSRRGTGAPAALPAANSLRLTACSGPRDRPANEASGVGRSVVGRPSMAGNLRGQAGFEESRMEGFRHRGSPFGANWRLPYILSTRSRKGEFFECFVINIDFLASECCDERIGLVLGVLRGRLAGLARGRRSRSRPERVSGKSHTSRVRETDRRNAIHPLPTTKQPGSLGPRIRSDGLAVHTEGGVVGGAVGRCAG